MKQFLAVLLCVSFTCFAQSDSDFEKANTAFAANQFDEAYIHLKNSLRDKPDHLPSKILMGKVLALSFYYDDAILEFYEALSAGADPNLISEFLASALLVERRFADVIALSSRGLSDKNKGILFANQAKAEYRLGNFNKAQSLFLNATQLSPNNAAIWDAYAKFQLNRKDIDGAKASADKARKLDSEYSETYRTLARISKLEGDLDAHIANLQSALAIDPNQPLALRDLVAAYMEKQDYVKAEASLQSILATSSQDPMARFLLSWVQSQQGQMALARETLNELVNFLSLINSDTLNEGDALLYISGMANYAAGNIEAAVQDLTSFLNKQPQSLNASILLAQLYESQNSVASAISVLERFSKEAESDLSLGSRLCSLYLKVNLNHKCDRLVRTLSKYYQSDDDFIMLEAKLLAARDKPEQALDALKAVKTNSASLMVNKALLMTQLEDFESAKAILNHLLAENPKDPDYQNLMAGVLIKAGEQDKAQTLLRALLKDSPEHFAARFNLASVYVDSENIEQATALLESMNQERPQQSSVLLLLARAYKQSGKVEAALDLLIKVQALSPDLTEAKVEIADVYSRLGDYDRAILTLNSLIKDNFLEPEYIAQRADTYLRANDYESARKDLATLYGIFRDNADSLYDLALFQKRAEDYQGALTSVSEAVKLSPENYLANLELARLLINSKDVEQAKQALVSIKKKFGETADYLLLEGDLHVLSNELVVASTFYKRAIEQDPYFAQALLKSYELAKLGFGTQSFKDFVNNNKDESYDFLNHLAGDLYLELEQYKEAKAHYRKIVANNTYLNMAFVLNNLANIYLLESDYKQANKLAIEAYEKLGKEQTILDTLGWTYTKLGQYTEGLSYLRQSFSMNTADPSVRYHLAYTLHKLNRINEAKRELETLLMQFGQFDDRDEAEKLLKDIRTKA